MGNDTYVNTKYSHDISNLWKLRKVKMEISRYLHLSSNEMTLYLMHTVIWIGKELKCEKQR